MPGTTAPTQAAPTLPDGNAAFNTLFDGVYQRVFFTKLAQLRPEYMPQTEKQAAFLLDMAGKCRLVADEEAVKQAEAASDPFAAASAALDAAMVQNGYPVDRAQWQEEQVAIKHAAADWAQDPTIYNAVLALKAEEAERFLAQAGQQR